MAKTFTNKNGRTVTLLNPAEKGKKFAQELKEGYKLTNTFEGKRSNTGDALWLTDVQKAYRSGYLDSRKDSAKAYKHNMKKR